MPTANKAMPIINAMSQRRICGSMSLGQSAPQRWRSYGTSKMRVSIKPRSFLHNGRHPLLKLDYGPTGPAFQNSPISFDTRDSFISVCCCTRVTGVIHKTWYGSHAGSFGNSLSGVCPPLYLLRLGRGPGCSVAPTMAGIALLQRSERICVPWSLAWP